MIELFVKIYRKEALFYNLHICILVMQQNLSHIRIAEICYKQNERIFITKYLRRGDFLCVSK
jgi:hypothetical protein